MAKTYAVRLEEIEAAIEAIEQRGQSYTINGRSLTRADLSKLYAEQKYLKKMADRETRGGGVRIRYGVPVE